MQYIGIYCSASLLLRPVFREEAIKLGKWIGQKGKTLINGGSNQGLMEVFSKAVHENGGRCIGIIPESLSHRGWDSEYTDEKLLVKDLSERKNVIKQRSDILMAFPGGIGTMDELFDAWSSYNLGFHDKKIILLNIGGFFNPLLQQLELFREEKFLHDFLPSPLLIVDSVDQCIELLGKLETKGCENKPLGFEFQVR
jgi:uncharacterized protein (TIGR00730 family)